MNFTPRDIQLDAFNKCLEVLLDKKGRKEVAVLPCAFGKSWLICMLSERLQKEGKILVLQPSSILLKQNTSKLEKLGIKHSVFSASVGKKDLIQDIIYATPKSLSYDILKDIDIKYVLIDEADYNSRPDSHIVDLLKQLKIKSVLGLTASPLYLNQTPEGSVTSIMCGVKGAFFKDICCVINPSEMVSKKYWCNIQYYNVFDHSKEDLLKLNDSGSEYTESSQKDFYKACNLKEKISTFLKRLPKGEDALVFVPSIEDAEELKRELPNSDTVHSKKDKKDCEIIIEKFKNNKLDILINVGNLLAGFDKEALKNLIDCSCSNSIRVKTQKDGRICRISDGKEFGRIVDFAGNYNRFGDVRDLHYEYVQGYGWGLFGKDDILLTDVPMNHNKKYTKEDVIKNGKPQIEYVFGEHNDGTAKMTVGKYKNKSLKFLYYRKRFYLKWLIENNYKFKEEDKEFERQLKMIYP